MVAGVSGLRAHLAMNIPPAKACGFRLRLKVGKVRVGYSFPFILALRPPAFPALEGEEVNRESS